jgi:ribonuclease HII
VVAAAVVFPPESRRINGIRDSKALPREERETLALRIRSRAMRVGGGASSCREIDRLNIRVAAALAMRRAVLAALRAAEAGSLAPYVVIIDGLPLPEIGYAHEALVEGDAYCYSIAAASIVAKTVRDRIMRSLSRRHPAYGWETNVGYGTPEHLEGLSRAGATRHHRMSFAPCAQRSLFGP